MLNASIDNPATRVYAVFHDLSFKEAPTVEAAAALRPCPILLVVKSNTGRTQSLYSQDYFAHSAYRFIQPGRSTPYYDEQGWKLLRVGEPQDRSRNCYLTIADPTGAENVLHNATLNSNWSLFFQIEGICNALRLIRYLAPYQNWQQFEATKGYYADALSRVDLTRPYYNQNVLEAQLRMYLWKLGTFLADNHRTMSLTELRQHLMRNNQQVTYAKNEFNPRKMDGLIRNVELWLTNEMGLANEAVKIARVFVS